MKFPDPLADLPSQVSCRLSSLTCVFSKLICVIESDNHSLEIHDATDNQRVHTCSQGLLLTSTSFKTSFSHFDEDKTFMPSEILNGYMGSYNPNELHVKEKSILKLISRVWRDCSVVSKLAVF